HYKSIDGAIQLSESFERKSQFQGGIDYEQCWELLKPERIRFDLKSERPFDSAEPVRRRQN
ncbi:MAG: hypothetical protein ACK55Z_26815, partial [bacterium]